MKGQQEQKSQGWQGEGKMFEKIYRELVAILKIKEIDLDKVSEWCLKFYCVVFAIWCVLALAKIVICFL